jgi:hypothetical protein
METVKISPLLINGLKKRYAYMMEFYSVAKKNEILLFVGKWIELENIILSEVNQIQMAKSLIFSLIFGI